ncbi:MAG: diacylglycerol kinase family lipid kinase [Bacteroidales bacterium]|jgi:YegS/Rv2252/BmrU family lipid kinase|nr:diacylglycerol kinase family lipid kinase [Bacteroidales bacterium]MDD2569942.1 diacylglycerol kinase family lipid kinase [Bacteroidales bacterium]MDD3385403.1 diacylglycerol kinase family lipid kinase [Bacteroidales bacterium]MDD3810672.1 diacylglycerol kinase family lipid kinase [Bacteroidales bacterium]MDD3871271.1 diacylglycerol kinase family lipid kinase [Bacteroidales bacterium]
MRIIGFILHGKIRGKKSVKATLIERFQSNYTVRMYETTCPRVAESLANQAIEEGCDYLVAVGGDGTLNEVINGYLKCQDSRRDQVILGLLPYGTGNDFARGLGIRRDLDQFEALLEKSAPVKLDAGALRFRKKDGSLFVRYFDNIADLGLGADVVARVNGVHLRKKVLGGTLTFFLSVIATFVTFRHKHIKVTWDGFSWEGPVLSLVVANGRYFGSGFGIAPEARMDDGLFEVVILGKLSIIHYLKNFANLRACRKVDHPEVFYYRTSSLKVEEEKAVSIVEADGELEGNVPLEFECLPGVLNFLVP